MTRHAPVLSTEGRFVLVYIHSLMGREHEIVTKLRPKPLKTANFSPPAAGLNRFHCREFSATHFRGATLVSHPPGHALLAAAVRKERGEGASEGRTDA